MISPLSHVFIVVGIYCWLVQYWQEYERSWCASHAVTTVTAVTACRLDISALLLTTEHISWLGCLIFNTHTFSKPINVIDLWDTKRQFYDWLLDWLIDSCLYFYVYMCVFPCLFVFMCVYFLVISVQTCTSFTCARAVFHTSGGGSSMFETVTSAA